MKQKRKKLGRKLLSFWLTLAMVVGLMPGMSLTVYAVNVTALTNSSTNWTGDLGANNTVTINDNVTVTGNTWLRCTNDVTVNGSLTVNAYLCVYGPGKLYVNGNVVINSGQTLHVYGSDDGTRDGVLVAKVSSGDCITGSGKLEVDGCVTASGGENGVGIKGVTLRYGTLYGSDAAINEENKKDSPYQKPGLQNSVDYESHRYMYVDDGYVDAQPLSAGDTISAESRGIKNCTSITLQAGGYTSETESTPGTETTTVEAIGNQVYFYNGKIDDMGCGEYSPYANGKVVNFWQVVSNSEGALVLTGYEISHTHNFTYSANSDTITATCGNDGCDLTDSKAILTIAAPTLTTYGGTGSAAATLTGLDAFNTATDKTIAATDIKYVGRDGTTYTESTTVPSNAGKYTASITVEEQTASVDYEIAQATTTITVKPTASDITYGQTLANSTLTGGTGSVAGSFAWKDSTVAPVVSDSQNTEYDVVFTPTDENYGAAECKVKLTVNKADSAVTTAPTAKTLTYNGSAQSLINAGTASSGTMKYAVTTANQEPAAEAYTFDNTSIPTATNAGTYYVWYKAVGDDDHIDTTPTAVTVTVGKADLDLSVSLEGWAYGAKANTPEVTGNTGKGTVTYIYKAKDADDKNYSDAVPTAAGTYTVKATVAETDNYNAGTATADFTISKEDGPSDKDEFVVTKAPTAKTLTYTGSAQELVTAGTATGGEMQYALGTATEATQPYTISIPSATNAGTYYVWYRVVGDGFESSAGCVTVVINEEEKLKPGDIVVSEGDLVSEPVAETKYVTAEATVNGEKLSVTISENFVNAIAYTGKRIDAVAHLSMSFDKTPIVSRFKIVDGSSVKPEDLIKVSYVQKYNKRANAAKKSKPTVYARIKVSKDAKKALSREDYKSIKKLVKKLNRELKKNQFNYRINQRSVTDCEVKVVAKHGADGKIIVKNGKISGVKKVIVSIDVKDPKTGEITKNTFKLSKKEYSISDPDPENGTVRLTGKRNFTGTVTVKVE